MSGTCRAFAFDTMLAQHLLQPDLPHSLGFLGSIFVQKPAWKHESGADLELYCNRDTDVTFQCYQQLKVLLRAEKLIDLYKNVSVPLARICLDMHTRGITIDPSRIGKVREKILEEMGSLENALPQSLRRHAVTRNKRTLAPEGTLSPKTGKPIKFLLVPVEEEEIPWRSQDEVTKYLYQTLGLPIQLHVKSAEPTVDKTALVKLARLLDKRVQSEENIAAAKTVRALQRLRALSTLETSFCKEELLVTDTLHPSFNVHGTSSGRLSSSDPNVQNIPESARFIYVPSTPNARFLAVDYSSIENRLTAFFANDTERLNRWSLDPAFNEHKWVASQFFNVPYEEVVKDNSKDAPYGIAKRIGHGCWTPYTEILQRDGWKRIVDYKDGEIATWRAGEIKFETPEAFNEVEFKGDLVSLEGTAFAACVTPDHTFPVESVWKDRVYHKKHEACNLPKGSKLPVTGILEPISESVFDNDIRRGIAIQADSYVQDGVAYFHIVRPRKQQRLQLLFDVAGKPCGCHPTGLRFKVSAKSSILEGKSFTARLLDLSQRQRLIFLEEILFWDGTRGQQKAYINTDYAACTWVQTMAHLSGRQGLLREIPRGKGHFGNKLVYKVSLNPRRLAVVGKLKRGIEPWSGKVYCFSTKSGYFLARHNGTIVVSGNSNYGMGPKKISMLFDMDFKTVRDLCAKWRVVNAKTVAWQEETAARAKKDGVLVTPFGRKRWFYTDSAYTESLSFLPQSTAADVIFRAMIALSKSLPNPTRIVLQVHDSLLFELPGIQTDEILEMVLKTMTCAIPELPGLNLPVEYKLGDSGESWGETESK